MNKELFIEKYTQSIQKDLDIIKRSAKKTENKLFTLTSILFIVVLGTLALVNYFDIHLIFFILVLFMSFMAYYLGTYVFKYEYKDILEQKIFPKILNILIEKARFTINNKDLRNDTKKSDIFFLYNNILASRTIQSDWSIQYVLDKHQITIASTYINTSDINNPVIPFSNMQQGLFISINDVSFFDSEVYIFEKKLFPSIKEVNTFIKKDFKTENILDDKYVVYSKIITKEIRNITEKIVDLFGQGVSITFKEGKIYVFIEERFVCFNSDYYANGKVPAYSDYIELLDIVNSIEQIIDIYKHYVKQ